MPRWLALGFQDRSSIPIGELSSLHDYVIVIMARVLVLISYVMVYLLFRGRFYKHLSEGTFIETVWSMVPAFLLVILVLPSMKVLYLMEDIKLPSFSFKIIGHQWYWSYVVPLFNNFSFKLKDSHYFNLEYDSLLEDFSLDSDYPRLLGCSRDLWFPVNTTSRLLVSSTDVIHSFAVPALGLKVDAMPGRINQLYVNPSRVGVFYGQCSEICGSNHSFIPIRVKVGCVRDYDNHTKSFLLELVEDSYSFKVSFLSFSYSNIALSRLRSLA